ncbi:hypothetical protein JIN77_08790 [Verrucomicrobiaceae bacterium R5-34]|nr:hypothetical protein [Verrucomicrobiaceae bacterium R5-34]
MTKLYSIFCVCVLLSTLGFVRGEEASPFIYRDKSSIQKAYLFKFKPSGDQPIQIAIYCKKIDEHGVTQKIVKSKIISNENMGKIIQGGNLDIKIMKGDVMYKGIPRRPFRTRDISFFGIRESMLGDKFKNSWGSDSQGKDLDVFFRNWADDVETQNKMSKYVGSLPVGKKGFLNCLVSNSETGESLHIIIVGFQSKSD